MVDEAVVLFSGGMDSLAALVYALKRFDRDRVTAMYVDFGHRYNKKELEAVKSITSKLGVGLVIRDMKFVGRTERRNAFIPYRNAYLILAAASYLSEILGSDDYGVIFIQNVQVGEENVGDRTEEFNSLVQELLNRSGDRHITIRVPFQNYTKGQIASWLKENVSEEIVKETIGCYDHKPGNCGLCRACFRRWIALEYAGFKDVRSWFRNDPINNPHIKEYIEKIKRGHYDIRRSMETLNVLAKYGFTNPVKIYAVDFDGVLSLEGKPWDLGKPNTKVIREVNRLYNEGNYIIIYTSRPEEDYDKIYKWLLDNGVKFHKIVTGKLYYDYIIDDKAVKLEV